MLGTSSTEPVLPRMLEKLEKLGCKKGVVGLVLPTGYSFNLDGTAIYLSLAAVFIAQACNIDLSLGQVVTMLAIMLLSSKRRRRRDRQRLCGAGFDPDRDP